jgi:hypothetical protein
VTGSCKIWGSRFFPLFYVGSYWVKTVQRYRWKLGRGHLVSTMGVGFELARLIVLNLKICLNIGFFTTLKFWQPRGDANMRRRIWKTFPIFLSCLTKWNFKLQLLPVERRFVHITFFGILLTLARSRYFRALWPFIPTC